ncbi:MAG: DUF4136 domain-containing protein [Pseudomonadota bacterium]
MRIKTAGLLAGLAMLVQTFTGCASGPDLRTDFDPDADFSQYETYAFAAELGTDRAGYSSLISQYFKTSINTEMQDRGYRYVEDSPDLIVNFFTSTEDHEDVRTRPSTSVGVGYYGYRYGLYSTWPIYGQEVETVRYRTGTATIDVVDAGRKQLIWEGVAEGRLTKKVLNDPQPAIQSAVRELFLEYPARAGVAATR